MPTGATLLEQFQAVQSPDRNPGRTAGARGFRSSSRCPTPARSKWHLAHTTWFFETFILKAAIPGYIPRFPQYHFLFNSYYNALGERIGRDRRGLLSRPTIGEVDRYRHEVDARVEDWLGSAELAGLAETVVLGLHHEQQHQELILTDIKHAFASNPLRPTYQDRELGPPGAASGLRWVEFPGGVREVGHAGAGFAFDNEAPRHLEYVGPFELASRPVTVEEFLAFLDDGGYERPEFWLSDGWSARKSRSWSAPLYWEREGQGWTTMTLAGPRGLALDEPVTHLSYYEGDAFARWSGARLPTEAEWEVAATGRPIAGNFLESGLFHPSTTLDLAEGPPAGLFGDVWEWTASPYTPYPGYRPAAGALGEYNGKFMCNQMVLRGGSCATPRSHIRSTYRNFFPPDARWQFSGIRLARDVA